MHQGLSSRPLFYSLFVWLYVGIGNHAIGQTDLKFGSLTKEDGLSHSTVNSITQDTFGFIWIGTMDGLNRYDGRLVEVFKNDKSDATSLANNTVWKIFVSSKNQIWIGTSEGICFYDYSVGHFQRVSLSHSDGTPNPVRRIIEDANGAIWIISTLDGLVKLEEKKDGSYEVKKFKGDFQERILSQNGHSDLSRDPLNKDILWFLVSDGLLTIDINTFEIENFENLLKDYKIDDLFFHSITVDHKGVLWLLCTSNGIIQLDIERKKKKHFIHSPGDPKSIGNNDLSKILEDRNHNLWISSLGSGLNLMRDGNKEEFETYRSKPFEAKSLLSDNVVDIFEDESGIIWLGTHGAGVQYIIQKSNPFFLYTSDREDKLSIPSNNITAVYEDRKGYTWIGTRNDGFTKAMLDSSKTKIESIVIYDGKNPKSRHIKNNAAVSFFESDSLGLIIGMRLGGVQVYDYENDSFRSYFYKPGDMDEVKDYHVNVIKKTSEGDLFLGTFNGVYFWDQSSRQLIDFTDQHPDLEVVSSSYITLLKNTDSELWIGTGSEGVYVWDKIEKKLIPFPNNYIQTDSISLKTILSFFEDAKGVYWIGSWDGGLLKYHPTSKEIKIYDERYGLNNRVIYSIQGDQQGYLWVSTNKGISKFDPEEEIFYNFKKSDGLQGEEYNSRVGYVNNETGHIFFGGMEGLNSFLPSDIKTELNHPSLYINKLTIYEEDASPKDITVVVNNSKVSEVTISHKCYLMDFILGAPKSPVSAAVNYAYKLEGLSDNWIDLDKTQEFSLTNLATGQYTLKLRSILENGSTSQELAMLSIISLPPWWHTWWAYFFYCLLTIAALYGIYTYRIRQIIKYQSLRTQISSDLHDDVGTILSTIAFQAEIMELENKKSQIEGFGKLTKLSRLAMGRMRDTVWAMDARRDNTDSLLARMNDFLFDAFDHQEIEYEFDHSQVKKGASIPPNIRQTIYLVFKESVSNALKHSSGTMIRIYLKIDGKKFSLKVHDNGNVNPAKMKTSGLGLANMKARAEKVDASFSIHTTNGFEVKLEKN